MRRLCFSGRRMDFRYLFWLKKPVWRPHLEGRGLYYRWSCLWWKLLFGRKTDHPDWEWLA